MAGAVADLADGALVARHREGEDDGYDVLYRRFYGRLTRLCERRTGDRALAEDLAQETLVRTLAHLDRFDTSRPMWPWLKTVATNLTIDVARAKRPEVGWEDDDADPTPGADDTLSWEDRQVLAQAMAQVPTRQRLALGLRYVHDWDTAEAANFLGLTRTGFEQLLFRARNRLRTEYQRASGAATARLGAALAPLAGAWRRLRVAATKGQSFLRDPVLETSVRLEGLSALGSTLSNAALATLSVATVALAVSPAAAGAESALAPPSLLAARRAAAEVPLQRVTPAPAEPVATAPARATTPAPSTPTDPAPAPSPAPAPGPKVAAPVAAPQPVEVGTSRDNGRTTYQVRPAPAPNGPTPRSGEPPLKKGQTSVGCPSPEHRGAVLGTACPVVESAVDVVVPG